jgi:hypothetical protein
MKGVESVSHPSTDVTMPICLTAHARQRGAQRGISPSQVALVTRLGRREHGHGAVHYFFGRQEVRRYRPLLGPRAEDLLNLVVVTKPDHVVLTVYRNEHASRLIRRKGNTGRPMSRTLGRP